MRFVIPFLCTLFFATPMQAQDCAMPAEAAGMKDAAAALINAQRAKSGRKALVVNPLLEQAAQMQACHVAETGDFSHKGAGGSSPKDRVKSTGFCTRLTAENLAWGQGSAQQVVSEWMNSSGHRKNIEARKVGAQGIGIALMNGRPVWVAVFADPC